MKNYRMVVLLIVLALFPALTATLQAKPLVKEPVQMRRAATTADLYYGDIRLVESVPEETDWDHPDIPNTRETWLSLISEAESTLDIEQFYFSWEPNTGIDDVIKAVWDAAERGVKVRIIADTVFFSISRPALDKLNLHPNISIAIIDVKSIYGGVQHAKYFVVDKEQVFIGSQNFDWKSLTQIFELGVVIKNRRFAGQVMEIFEHDWSWATTDMVSDDDISDQHGILPVELEYRGESVFVSPVATFGPESVGRELDGILTRINEAKKNIAVQVMNFGSEDPYGGTRNDSIENALIAAAQRGVTVKLLVSDWSLKPTAIPSLKRLQEEPGIEVKVISIPRLSNRYLSYARVSHAKYMVVDKERGWIGSSNWEPGYFSSSQNVGIVFEGKTLGQQLRRVFLDYWTLPVSEDFDPQIHKTPPFKSD